MLSKSQIKVFSSLKSKKFRQKYGLFLVEGKKSVQELLKSDYDVMALLFRDEIVDYQLSGDLPCPFYTHCSAEIKAMSSFSTPPEVIAVVKNKIPELKLSSPDLFNFPSVSVFLDQIQDPGNLGAIMRNALWFGIEHLLLGPGCADPFNPKVIQASMGAFTRVTCLNAPPELWLGYAKNNNIAVLGAALKGQNIHNFSINQSCIVVLGNEGAGITKEVEPFLTHHVTIPGCGLMESLNVASASAIILDNIYRLIRT